MGKLVFKPKSDQKFDLLPVSPNLLKVLIVDDEKDVHSVTRFALKNY